MTGKHTLITNNSNFDERIQIKLRHHTWTRGEVNVSEKRSFKINEHLEGLNDILRSQCSVFVLQMYAIFIYSKKYSEVLKRVPNFKTNLGVH